MPEFWELAPPGYRLRLDIEKKKRKLLPDWLEANEQDFGQGEPEPDFAAEEQAGLTALGQTQQGPYQLPTGLQNVLSQRAGMEKAVRIAKGAKIEPLSREPVMPSVPAQRPNEGFTPFEIDETGIDRTPPGTKALRWYQENVNQPTAMTGASLLEGKGFSEAVAPGQGLTDEERKRWEERRWWESLPYEILFDPANLLPGSVVGRKAMTEGAERASRALVKGGKRVAELSAKDQRGGIKLPGAAGKGAGKQAPLDQAGKEIPKAPQEWVEFLNASPDEGQTWVNIRQWASAQEDLIKTGQRKPLPKGTRIIDAYYDEVIKPKPNAPSEIKFDVKRANELLDAEDRVPGRYIGGRDAKGTYVTTERGENVPELANLANEGIIDFTTVSTVQGTDRIKQGTLIPGKNARDIKGNFAKTIGEIDIEQSRLAAQAGKEAKPPVSETATLGKIPVFRNTLEQNRDNPQALVEDIVAQIGEDEFTAIGLRGIYKQELNKKSLRASFESPEGKRGRRLSGTSVQLVTGNWSDQPLENIQKGIQTASSKVDVYGDQEYIAVVKGTLQKDEIFNDPGEAVLSDAKVIGYIRRKTPAPEPVPPSTVAQGISFQGTVYRGKIAGSEPVDAGLWGKGIYYTSSKDIARNYGGGRFNTEEIQLKNAYLVDTDEKVLSLNKIGEPFKPMTDEYAQKIRDTLEAQGYDGIIIKTPGDVFNNPSTDYVVFKPTTAPESIPPTKVSQAEAVIQPPKATAPLEQVSPPAAAPQPGAGVTPPVKITPETVAQVASEKNLDDLYEAASETINRQTKAQGLPEATPPPAVASSRGGRKPPTGKGPTSQGGSAPNDSVGKVNELVYGIPGENNARASARKWDGARRTMGVEINAQWESGRKMLKGQTTDKDTMLGLYQALHGEGPVPQGQDAAYNAIKAIMDKEAADMLAFDPSFSKAMMAHPDYFWRGWREPKASQIGAGRMGATPGFKKPRVDATFTEMVNEGWEPVSWNPFDMAALRRMAGVEYRENAVLVRRLKEAGYALPKDEIPQKGWRVPHVGPAFEGRPFVGQDGKVAFTPPVAVPNPIASQLEGIYGVRPNLGGIGPYIGKFTDALKLGKVAFSLFQHVDYGFRAGFAASSQILRAGKPNIRPVIEYPSLVGRLVNVSLRKSPRDVTRKTILSNTPLYPNGPSLRMIGEEGWMMGSDITFIRRGVMDAVQDAIKDAPTNVLGKAKERIRNIARFTESGLFEGVARESQAWTLEKVIIPNLKKTHPDWTARQIAGSAADEVNVMYSTLGVWQSTFKDPSLRELLRTLLFSVNESEAWLKMLVRGFKGENQRLWGEFGIGTMVFLAGVGNAINYSTTGKPLDANQYSPLSFDSPYAFLPGGIGYNNRFMSPKLPFKGKEGTDLYLDLVGQADTVYRWLLDPPGAVTARYNVLPRAALNQWKGEAFGGRKLETPGERVKQGLSDLFTPIGPGNIMEAARQNIPQVENILPAGETRLGTKGSLAQATGLNVRSLNQREFDEALAKKKGLLAEGESLENKPALRKQVGFLPESQSYAAALGNTQANKIKEADFADYNTQLKRDAEWTNNQMTSKDWRAANKIAAARRAAQRELKELRNEIFKKKNPNDLDKAMERYYKLIDDNYDKVAERFKPDMDWELDYFMNSLSGKLRQDVIDNLHPRATPLQKQYYADMETLKPYFDVVDKSPLLQDKDIVQAIKIIEGLKNQITKSQVKGDQREVIVATREALRLEAQFRIKMHHERLAIEKRRIRYQNPEIDRILVKWGYVSKPLRPLPAAPTRELAGVK